MVWGLELWTLLCVTIELCLLVFWLSNNPVSFFSLKVWSVFELNENWPCHQNLSYRHICLNLRDDDNSGQQDGLAECTPERKKKQLEWVIKMSLFPLWVPVSVGLPFCPNHVHNSSSTLFGPLAHKFTHYSHEKEEHPARLRSNIMSVTVSQNLSLMIKFRHVLNLRQDTRLIFWSSTPSFNNDKLIAQHRMDCAA